MAATLAMEPAAKVEAGCGEEEAQHLLSSGEEAAAGSISRRTFAARSLVTVALLLCGAIAALVLASMPGGFPGAATARSKPSRPLAWFQRLSEISDCDVAKLAGAGCVTQGFDVNVKHMCEERCMDGWHKVKEACEGDDAESARVLLKGCSKAEKNETSKHELPKDSTEQLEQFLEGLGDLGKDGEKNGKAREEEKLLDDMFGKGTIECATVSLGIMQECGPDKLGTTAQCSVECMEALSKSEGCDQFDDEFSSSIEVLRSVCGGCGRAMMELNEKAAQTCDLDDTDTEDGKDWKPCAAKCHPVACMVAKECVPGIKDAIPGMTKRDLVKFHNKVTEDMKECPCDA